MTLQTSLLNRTATYINTQVAKITINGTHDITSFEIKSASNNKVNLQYIVPFAVTNLITLIEVKDANNVVLSSNVVSIPVTSDHLQIQSLTVREGV